MLLCTLQLAQGSTMLCLSIKSGIIKHYLAAVAAISIDHQQIDPLKDTCGQKNHRGREVKRFNQYQTLWN